MEVLSDGAIVKTDANTLMVVNTFEVGDLKEKIRRTIGISLIDGCNAKVMSEDTGWVEGRLTIALAFEPGVFVEPPVDVNPQPIAAIASADAEKVEV